MSTFLLKRIEIVEIVPSQVEHIQGTYNGWTLAVDSVEARFHDSFSGPRPDHGVKLTLNCVRVNKDGKRGVARIGEDFFSRRSEPRPVPRWVIPMLLDHKPAWFESKISELFQGTDRCTIDTARGPLLTWRAPR